MPWGINHLFLLVNVVAMTGASILVIARKYSEYAVGGLIGVVVTQALGYGLIFDLNFFLRNLSVMGGLIMVLSDSWVRKKFAPAGLPQLDEKDRKMYFQLAGRVLLVFLFVGFVFAGQWSFGRVIVILFGAVACVMVVVGFKAKWSAIVLVMILSIFNILVNNFWTVSIPNRSSKGANPNINLLAPPTSPPQGLRQVRLLPDPLYRGRSAPAGQHGSRSSQFRREEEGLLENVTRLANTVATRHVGVKGRKGNGNGELLWPLRTRTGLDGSTLQALDFEIKQAADLEILIKCKQN